MEYLVTFANTPFVTDKGRAFRMSQKVSEAESKEYCEGIQKYQPLDDLIDEIDRLLPFDYLHDFFYPTAYPGRKLGGIAYRSDQSEPGPKIRIGDWYYPNTACRWSVFRGLATSQMVKGMLGATGAVGPATFVMQSAPRGAPGIASTAYRLETSMYMLPPRPLAEHGKKFAGLYLVTLVDERYYFQNTPVSLHVDYRSTWESLINQVALALNITITPADIPSIYGKPELDSQLWTNWEQAPILLDALAANIGKIVVRKMNGSYTIITPVEANALAVANRASTTVIRVVGGDIFNSDTRFGAGDLRPAKNSIVPRTINVTFPLYVVEDDPVPHLVNSRFANQRRSAWFEDSYGDVYTVAVPIASGGPLVSGLTGINSKTVHNTAKALISGEIQITGGADPINLSGIRGLAVQIAQDQYSMQVMGTLDEVYPGTFKWEPDGCHDILWTYSERSRQASCRVMRSPYTMDILEFQHATPPISGFSPNVKGVGGKTVAQTIKDSVGFSGTFTGAYLTAILFSGQTVAALSSIDNLPTDNRWRGRVESEVILFEGTSGGYPILTSGGGGYELQTSGFGGYSLQTSGSVSSGTLTSGSYSPSPGASISGWAVQIVFRGIDGTQETSHVDGWAVTKLDPDVGYGINLTTYGKNQYIFPSEWTSGGIHGVNVVPQTQFVLCLEASGVVVSGAVYYSGLIQLYNAARADCWVSGNLVWLIGANTVQSGGIVDSGLQSGIRYGANFVGYSTYTSGLSGVGIVAPVYVPVGGTGGGGGAISITDQFSGFIGNSGTSGFTRTNLIANFVSGDKAVFLSLVDYLPTQNRWKAIIGSSGYPAVSGEEILLEGTSGGLKSVSGYTVTSGYVVNVVKRGIRNTLPASGLFWLSGTTLTEMQPHVVSGFNIITHEKSQFIYPKQIESGLVGVSIVPQIQSVAVLAGSGKYINSVLHYSGVVVTYDPTQLSGNWTEEEYVWVRERNATLIVQSGLLLSGPLSGGFPENYLSGTAFSGTTYSGMTFSGQVFSGTQQPRFSKPTSLNSGKIYDGQLVAYSKRESGSVAAPVYAVNNFVESNSFQATLTAKQYVGNIPVYTWEADGPNPFGQSGGSTAAHEEDFDLAVPTNVRMHNDPNGGFVMGDDPRWEVVRKTSTSLQFVPYISGSFVISSGTYSSGSANPNVSGGFITSGSYQSGSVYGAGGYYYPGVLLRWQQDITSKGWVTTESIWIVDANQ